MYVLEHEISSKELLSRCTSKQVVTRDKLKATQDKRPMERLFGPVHRNRLPGSKHEELQSSKTARQWKNPL